MTVFSSSIFHMDSLFLYRFAQSLRNVYRMLLDRGYQVDPGLASVPIFELASELYKRAIDSNQSLGQSVHQVFTAPTSRSKCHIWSLDRNYDILRSRERMISTDQIKTLLEQIHETDADIHMVMSPNKLSPQAKKELYNTDRDIQLFLFDDLCIDLPRHELVLRHTVVSDHHLKSVLGAPGNANDLPVLPKEDPIARWYNFQINSIIFVDNPVMPTFRIVK